jgi:hypothetical protein
MAAFVSDGKSGQVTVPRSRLADLNRARLKGARVVIDDSEVKKTGG